MQDVTYVNAASQLESSEYLRECILGIVPYVGCVLFPKMCSRACLTLACVFNRVNSRDCATGVVSYSTG